MSSPGAQNITRFLQAWGGGASRQAAAPVDEAVKLDDALAADLAKSWLTRS